MSNLMNALVHAGVLELIVPAAMTETTTGTGVDVSAYEGMAVAVLHSAAGTGTTPTMNVKLRSCATVDGTYVDIAGATFVEVDDTEGGSIQVISFNVSAAMGFVLALATIAGTTPSFTASAALLGIAKAA